ncbi:MAG TPA: DUF397 domain-containing protein [Actinophytocola sp.]|jgi:hypothetical protein|uniref:DUF397 domain-containing protein n=1 Tax=Actinophytocola sp. TaxID=1872138 RepID=UPI002DF8FB01|nr:DUF397 domain-containing protein [Actinophytocola sp.]
MITPDAALACAEYRTSTYSTATGDCVMVGHAGGWVGIQDSKQHPRVTLPVPGSRFAVLVSLVRADRVGA